MPITSPMSEATRSPVRCVYSDGFNTTAFPAASAVPIADMLIAKG